MDEDKIANIAIAAIVVGIIFAKLMGWITWPWLWITSVIWIPLIIGTLIAIIFLLIFGLKIIIDKKEIRNERY